jgi:DNA-directed RNA polymerase specialized sigma24 family protein
VPDTFQIDTASRPTDNPLMRVILASLADLTPPAQAAMARFLMTWTDLPPERRALLLKILLPELSDQMIAAVVGVHRTTIYHWQSYKRLKACLEQPPAVLRGKLDDEGRIIEAWLENAG